MCILLKLIHSNCEIARVVDNRNYNRRQELLEQLQKTASYLTPQVMNNQFKRPFPWGLRQLYYIYSKT